MSSSASGSAGDQQTVGVTQSRWQATSEHLGATAKHNVNNKRKLKSKTLLLEDFESRMSAGGRCGRAAPERRRGEGCSPPRGAHGTSCPAGNGAGAAAWSGATARLYIQRFNKAFTLEPNSGRKLLKGLHRREPCPWQQDEAPPGRRPASVCRVPPCRRVPVPRTAVSPCPHRRTPTLRGITA